MSYSGMLKHRAKVYRLIEGSANGYSTMVWEEQPQTVACFLDLSFIRRGKDPSWTPEAGRVTVRTGVCFVKPNAPVESGDRLLITRGPAGVFSIESAVDPVWRPTNLHHLELGVQEVAQSTLGQAHDSLLPGDES